MTNHSFNHVSCRGVSQKCAFQWTGREGPEHTHNTTIQFLKVAHSPLNFATNNWSTHIIMSMTFHHTTHFLREWTKSTSTQSTTFRQPLQSDCARHST